MLKKITIFFIVAMLIGTAWAANTNAKIQASSKNVFLKQNSRDDVVAFEETFENGLNGWTTVDGTLPSSLWHVSDFNTPDGTGTAWWMGDEELGGYINSSYIALDTPEINVPAGGELTFDLNYNVEAPGGEPAGYDAWDGCNVRISTDNGATWEVITPAAPAYDAESLYSFGFEHGEGEGIAGWAGSSEGWVSAEFDLAAYEGQDVRIRFAFASDPAYCSEDDPNLFGMIVDNIALGSFSNDGVEGEMESTSIVPVGGDLWAIEEVANAPSGSNAMVCQNDEGSYNVNMLNYLYSPVITLPDNGQITADFLITGGFTDPDEFPEVDYWGFEISPVGDNSWYAMSNPYGDPDGDNYVYSDAPDQWASAIESYSLEGRIDDYAGQEVQFRIYFETDGDTPEGEGIMIDNFVITQSTNLPAPTNLVAETMGSEIGLTWENPLGDAEEGWMHWDSGENNDGVGINDAAVIDAAAQFDIEDIVAYTGMQITKIKFFPGEAACDYTLKIWNVAGTSVLYEQAVANPTIGAWNEITLDTPFVVEGDAIKIGYTADTEQGYPIGCDAGPMVDQKGGWIQLNGGGWSQIPDASGGSIDANWNIQAYVADAKGNPVRITTNKAPRLDLQGYNVYHAEASGEFDFENPVEYLEGSDMTSYVHTAPTSGIENYYVVKAVYAEGESDMSNEASAYVLPSEYNEYTYDDGTFEESLEMTMGELYANQFTFDETVTVKYVKLYVEEASTGNFAIKFFNDESGMIFENEIDGIPVTAANVEAGWNLIEIPEANQDDLTFDGTIYVAINSLNELHTFGMDNDNSGNSYYAESDESDEWDSLNNTLMLRLIVEGGTDAEDAPQNPINITNYPNPFNPVTNIKFNLPEETKASLKVYNIKGQLVKTLLNDVISGKHTITWKGKDKNNNDVASGVYFYKLETENKVISNKMLLLK